ncbi:MAG TPA: ribonuclease Z [Nitrososphaera sp.]|jgi:ribonuclease Z|nr:ribonuclease Z [Nitrososphaera sp.]
MVDMRLFFLGTSSAVPTASRGLSSIALMRGAELLLFDAGEGMQRNFIKAGLGINKKMKIFITHMHADHCVGLLGLLQTMGLQGREKSVYIYGEPRLEEFLRENMRIINFGLTFDIIVRKIEKGGVVVKEKDYQISCCETLHSVPSFAYCLEEFERPGIFNISEAKRLGIPEGELYGKLQHGQNIIYGGKMIKSTHVVGPPRRGRKIGISGDTRPTDKLVRFFKECDVLVFESTYGGDKQEKAIENGHSTAAEAATIAKKAKVDKLLLTHFSARYDETSLLVKEASAIHNNVEAAEDLKVVKISYRPKL